MVLGAFEGLLLKGLSWILLPHVKRLYHAGGTDWAYFGLVAVFAVLQHAIHICAVIMRVKCTWNTWAQNQRILLAKFSPPTFVSSLIAIMTLQPFWWSLLFILIDTSYDVLFFFRPRELQ